MGYLSKEKRNEYNRKWREDNRDKARAASKRWREANREKEYQRYLAWKEANPEKDWKRNHTKEMAEYNREYRKRNFIACMLRACKNSAKKRGLDFNLTKEDIVIPIICPVLGIPLTIETKWRTDSSISLDRVDTTRGYVKGNVAVVCWRVNRIKGSATLPELQAIHDFYSKFSTNPNPQACANGLG